MVNFPPRRGRGWWAMPTPCHMPSIQSFVRKPCSKCSGPTLPCQEKPWASCSCVTVCHLKGGSSPFFFRGGQEGILHDGASLFKHSYHAEEGRKQTRRHFLSPRHQLIISCFYRTKVSDTHVLSHHERLLVLLASPCAPKIPTTWFLSKMVTNKRREHTKKTKNRKTLQGLL